MAAVAQPVPIAVFYGDEEYQKGVALSRLLGRLLPPGVDRGLALVEYDGTRPEDQGGPSLAAILDDLMTPSFLCERRVVVIRDADKFISAHRERLEAYVNRPSRSGTLILTCRTFPSNTRLAKAAAAAGGELVQCKKLTRATAPGFVQSEVAARQKRMNAATIGRLVDLVGLDQGALAGEVEKLCLYVGERPDITEADVRALVGQSREERIFIVMDSAALGRLPLAMEQWRQALATDPDAAYKALGGMALVIRRWLEAQEAIRQGVPLRTVAGMAYMWGRERELGALLDRLPPRKLRTILAGIAELDAQVKVGARSIESGVERLLVALAGGCDSPRAAR
ncbi:MAG: DNA polymerase III subunit delta [Phycisphaerae bacterium]|nr:DNA polymerase III subunit delta [Phycisphaerae bacterium]MCZ2399443.1 DNA polymerase III subunit delta [Phycisphaerae bacterium]NUQ50850.1 DNA polymerase III subunit delta [Phycisphaerae bacterium]